MSQVTAGDVVTLTIGAETIAVKIEDGSKSESILAKVETSAMAEYQVGQVYEFDRALLKR